MQQYILRDSSRVLIIKQVVNADDHSAEVVFVYYISQSAMNVRARENWIKNDKETDGCCSLLHSYQSRPSLKKRIPDTFRRFK